MHLLLVETFLGLKLLGGEIVQIEMVTVGAKHEILLINCGQTGNLLILLQIMHQLYLLYDIRCPLVQHFCEFVCINYKQATSAECD